MSKLTHIGPDGRARMVDVGDKPVTARVAVARGSIRMKPETLTLATSRDTKKGDPIAIAELAGIMAAKKTADLIPLCHPLPLSSVEVGIEASSLAPMLIVTATVRTSGKTGVEMEALTAASVACLTLYDMLKSADMTMVIEQVELIEKRGGKSGDIVKDPV